MKIVKASYKILGLTPEIGRQKLQNVEYAARISHRSEELMNETSLERFISAVVVKHGDWSVTEHESVSVEMVIDRGCTHELVRHRIAAYTQESTRFVNYTKQMEASYIYPIVDAREEECPDCLNGSIPQYIANMYLHSETRNQCKKNPLWLTAIKKADACYQGLLASGWKPQDARSVLPNALASKIMVTMNLRSWRHCFLMRSTLETHPQLRQITQELLADFKRLIPIIYDDIEPNERQIKSISRGR